MDCAITLCIYLILAPDEAVGGWARPRSLKARVPWTEAVIGPRAAAEIDRTGAIRFVSWTINQNASLGVIIDGWDCVKMIIDNSTNGSNEISEISAASRGPANGLPVHGTHSCARVAL